MCVQMMLTRVGVNLEARTSTRWHQRPQLKRKRKNEVTRGRRWSGHLVGTITYSNPIRRDDAMFCLRGGVGGRHKCRGENRYDYLRGVALSSELRQGKAMMGQ